jgi:hypothetical protein
MAILCYHRYELVKAQNETNVPIINVLKNLVGTSFAVNMDKPLLYPCDDMVFEGSLNDLMKEVGREHFVYVGSREMCRE